MAKITPLPLTLVRGFPSELRHHYIALNPVDAHELSATLDLGIPVSFAHDDPQLQEVVTYLFRAGQLVYFNRDNAQEAYAFVGPFEDADGPAAELRDLICARGQTIRTFAHPLRDFAPAKEYDHPAWRSRTIRCPGVDVGTRDHVKELVEKSGLAD